MSDPVVSVPEPAASTRPEPMPTVWGMTRRGWTLAISAVALLALVAVAFLLPVPFVRLAPGPTFDVLGDVDGTAVIAIEGTTTYPVDGSLDMTTVLESGGPRGGLTFAAAIASWFNSADAVVPRELLFPDDMTGEQVRARQAMLFSTSESNAVAAAMTYLGKPVTVETVVTAVYGDTPAAGVLEPKDVLVSVDGKPVTDSGQVAQEIRSRPVGSEIAFEVERDGQREQVTVTSVPNPDDPAVPYVGIGVGPLFSGPFPIDFAVDRVGGPSAGLMFALGIVAKLSPDDLTGGRHIAGTGTIDPDGTVGPIGGIRQKLAGARAAGATMFLMPRAHCAEAAGHVPDGLTVVPVATLAQAVAAVEDYVAGRTLPTCPVEGSA